MNDLLCAMLFLLFFTFFFLTSKMCYTCLARQKPILPWKNNLSLYINDMSSVTSDVDWIATLETSPDSDDWIKTFNYTILDLLLASHSSTLARKIPWMEEPGRLQSMRLLRVRYNWATSLSPFTFMHWRRKWQPTHSSVLAWRVPGTGEPGGLPSLGSHRVGYDWSDLAAAAAADLLFTGRIK